MISLNQPSGGSFGSLTGVPGDNAALAAALALKLDKAGGIITGNGAASTPALTLNGTVFTGGSSTTTKPLHLIEPSGTTSNNWDTNGTLLGVNAPSGFTGMAFAVQKNGVNMVRVDTNNGVLFLGETGVLSARIVISSLAAGVSLECGGSGLGFGFRVPANISAVNGGMFQVASNDETIIYGKLRGIADAHLAVVGNASQTLSIYETTDYTNYGRLSFITAAGAYQIKPEAAGTGTLRDLHISGLPTSNPGPGILWNNAGTPAIGT